MITQIVEGVDGAHQARGVVVVIDVMRAFTTAAYAFGAGVVEIDLVATVEEALALPGFRMGEVGGRLIPDLTTTTRRVSSVGENSSGKGAFCGQARERAVWRKPLTRQRSGSGAWSWRQRPCVHWRAEAK